jgi:hypothetical protein
MAMIAGQTRIARTTNIAWHARFVDFLFSIEWSFIVRADWGVVAVNPIEE